MNCVAPAHIPTDINTHLRPGRDRAAHAAAATHGLAATTSPNAALFLASDRSAQVTGIVLPVDGGTTAGRPMVKFEDVAARPDAKAR